MNLGTGDCAPWSMLKISGTPNFAIASCSASTQKSAVRLVNTRSLATARAAAPHERSATVLALDHRSALDPSNLPGAPDKKSISMPAGRSLHAALSGSDLPGDEQRRKRTALARSSNCDFHCVI
jgi:hypothetical protein